MSKKITPKKNLSCDAERGCHGCPRGTVWPCQNTAYPTTAQVARVCHLARPNQGIWHGHATWPPGHLCQFEWVGRATWIRFRGTSM